MARRVLAWECQYCGALKRTEKIAVRHEKTCLKNPDSKNCLKCKNSYTDASWDGGLPERRCKVKSSGCSRAVSADCEYYTPLVLDGNRNG